MYGLIAVMIFMVLYYRLPGLLSVFSLAFYALLSLAVFKLIGVTLTLSGIAGFILSIGMAVDANVLVFERLKEELTTRYNSRARSYRSLCWFCL
jgi:preprotein translocase subunit SecD